MLHAPGIFSTKPVQPVPLHEYMQGIRHYLALPKQMPSFTLARNCLSSMEYACVSLFLSKKSCQTFVSLLMG